MKTKNHAKFLLVVLSLALLACAFLATTVSAETAKPEIKNMNVRYSDKFELMYAVPADTVSGGSATLYLYDEDPADGADAIKEYTLSKTELPADSGLDYEAYVFYTQGVSATALDQVFYVQVVDAENNASDVKSYSVVEYLYTKLADIIPEKPNTDVQENFWKSVINFGTCAQQRFLTSDELDATTLISDYCYVTTEGCTVNGKTAAVVPQGKAFDVAGDNGALSACTVTTYNTYDTTGTATETEVEGSSVTITGSARAHIVAGAAKTYKAGTETFESYAAGTGLPISDYNDGRYMFYGNDGKLRSQTVANDTVYGTSSTVLPLKLTAGQVQMFPVCSDVTAEEATAFEYSFDIKMDITETLAAYQAAGTTSAPERIGWFFYLVSTSGSNIERDIVRIFANYGNKLRADISLNYKNYVISDTPASEWHNIRIVFKNPDDATTTVEFYLDGAEEPTVYELVNYIDINTIGSVKFVRYNDTYDRHTIIYFDNVWCGYTNE